MQFIDLHRQYEVIKDDLNKRLGAVMGHKHFIMGPEVSELESKLASYTGRKYCLSCSNGTDALLIPLMAMKIGKGDAVFVSSYTYFASAEVVGLSGATPVFVDSDKTYDISPEALEKEILRVKNEGKLRPRLIISVDIFGLPCDYKKISSIAEKYDLAVLNDAAQAFGAKRGGKQSLSFGLVSSTSFFPAKPLGCYGDGGAIFTDDDELYSLMRSIRVHGCGEDRYDNVRLGLNARLDTIQAAVLLSKLEVFENEIKKKNEVAAEYSRKLNPYVEVPVIPDDCLSVLAQYTILLKDSEERDKVISALKEKGIPSMIYYRKPMHMQTAFSDLGYKPEDLPLSYDFSKRCLSLPMHAYLSGAEIKSVTDTVIDAVK